MGTDQAKGDVDGQSMVPTGLKTAWVAPCPEGGSEGAGEAGLRDVRLHLRAGGSHYKQENDMAGLAFSKDRPASA